MLTIFQFLADYAVEQGGKVHAVGAGFDTIVATVIPVRHEQMTLVCSIKHSSTETGTKHLAATIIDADGKPVTPPLGGDTVLQRPQNGPEGTIRLIIRWMNVDFPQYGAYSARVTLDGVQVADVGFTVVRPAGGRN